jgi:hypothetical protein
MREEGRGLEALVGADLVGDVRDADAAEEAEGGGVSAAAEHGDRRRDADVAEHADAAVAERLDEAADLTGDGEGPALDGVVAVDGERDADGAEHAARDERLLDPGRARDLHRREHHGEVR